MKIGLSLCGGGSKGAYELGVWDALREMNFEFDIVTGSSIGALNGAMYVQNTHEIAEKLWESVEITNIFENGVNIDEMNIVKFIKNEELKSFFKQALKEHKVNIEPFKNLLKTYLDFDKIRNSKILYGVSVTNIQLSLNAIKNEEILINTLSDDEMFNYILASCSMFPFFPVVDIEDKRYVDGGFSDNLPIEFAFKLGAAKVIAVDLNHKITHKEYLNSPVVDYIYPKYDLGSFLHFEKSVTSKNRKLGYNDAYKHFGKYVGFKYTFKPTNLFENESKLTTLKILNDSICFKNSQERPFIKKNDYEDIFNYLNQYINGKIKDNDYFIKCLEEICVIFNMDPSVVYDQNILIKELRGHLVNCDTSSVINEFVHLKIAFKKRDYLNTCDKKIMLGYFFQNVISDSFRMFLYQSNIDLYLSLVLIDSIKSCKEIGN